MADGGGTSKSSSTEHLFALPALPCLASDQYQTHGRDGLSQNLQIDTPILGVNIILPFLTMNIYFHGFWCVLLALSIPNFIIVTNLKML